MTSNLFGSTTFKLAKQPFSYAYLYIVAKNPTDDLPIGYLVDIPGITSKIFIKSGITFLKYTDEELKIRDYPELYKVIRNS